MSTASNPALGALEALVNRALELDPDSASQLSPLNGKRIGVTCTAPSLALSITIAQGRIALMQGIADNTGTKITGSAVEFIRIATASDPAAALINGEITIAGETAPLLELREILASLDLDWEAPLARLFGDVIGHTLGSGLRIAHKTALSAFGQLRAQFTRHMQEDSVLVPRPQDAQHLFDDIDDLRQRTERLQAKIQQLKSAG